MPDTHEIVLIESAARSAGVEACTELAISVTARCGRGCDLTGRALHILDDAGRPVAQVAIATSRGGRAAAGAKVQVPSRPGPHAWSVRLNAAAGDRVHAEATLPIAFTVLPHRTSLAVWGVTSPATAGAPVRLSVGVKCLTAACPLDARVVEVHDEAGRSLGQGTLGDAPLANTRGLYWTELPCSGPERAGNYTWRAVLPAERGEHEAGEIAFSLSATPAAEVSVLVAVRALNLAAPIPGAVVVLGRHHATTDGDGRARLRVPRGTYQLTVGRDGYQHHQRALEARDDLHLEVTLAIGDTRAGADLPHPPFDEPGAGAERPTEPASARASRRSETGATGGRAAPGAERARE